ncbi:hypothetical protein GCM10027415_24550 [Humibacter ginsengisoli]
MGTLTVWRSDRERLVVVSAALPHLLAQQEDRVTVLFRGTGGERPVVVKVSPNAGEFSREVRARELLAGRGLPLALPIAHQAGAPSTLTLPWIAGDAVNEGHPSAVHEQVGALIAQVHATSVPTDFAGNSSWSQWMAGWLSHALSWWKTFRSPDDVPAQDLEDRLIRLAPNMDEACGGAILFDGRPEHFIVGESGDIGMIDVEELRVGDPAMDIGVLATWIPGAIPAVLSGFVSGGGRVDAAFEKRVHFYTVLRMLAAAEWHREHLNDDRTAMDLLDRLDRSTV